MRSAVTARARQSDLHAPARWARLFVCLCLAVLFTGLQVQSHAHAHDLASAPYHAHAHHGFAQYGHEHAPDPEDAPDPRVCGLCIVATSNEDGTPPADPDPQDGDEAVSARNRNVVRPAIQAGQDFRTSTVLLRFAWPGRPTRAPPDLG